MCGANLAGMARCGPRSGHMGDIRNLRELAPSLLPGLPHTGPSHLFRGDVPL